MKNKVLNHRRIFGETVVVKNNKKKLHSNLEDRGIVFLFLGNSADHPKDTYIMLNFEIKKVISTRDIKWLNKMYINQDSKKRIATV